MSKEKRKRGRIVPKFILLVIMSGIGVFTAYTAANSYEIVTKTDIPLSSVITTIDITTDSQFATILGAALTQTYDPGSFGTPKKIKFGEANQHIDIISASQNGTGWIARAGLAQMFLTAQPVQKVFGRAIIYLRVNTATTQHLGDTISGDVVNIVTTEGWQLGYQIRQTATDPSQLNPTLNKSDSNIVVIMVDDNDASINSFGASLIKVGERI